MLRRFFANAPWILLAVAIVAIVGNYFYRAPKFSSGELAPAFSGQVADGQPFALEDLRGHYVLLDFWGSWCAPCRRQNPDIVALYDAFHGRVFEGGGTFHIVSIGIETDSLRWARAIAKDGLRWPHHLSALQRFDDPVAQLYGVREIPTSYLISPEGYVMGVNLPKAEYHKLLSIHLAEVQ